MSLLATTYIEHTTQKGDGYADPYITGLWCGVHGTPKVLGKIVFLPHFQRPEILQEESDLMIPTLVAKQWPEWTQMDTNRRNNRNNGISTSF